MATRTRWAPVLCSLPESERFNSVSEGAALLYTVLIIKSDDGGNYWGNPAMVLGQAFAHRMAKGSLPYFPPAQHHAP